MRFTGKSMVVQVETSTGNMTTLPNVTKVDLDQGTATKVDFMGGDFHQEGHAMRVYSMDVEYETDNSLSSGPWYIAQQVDRLDSEPRLIYFYPWGLSGGYFKIDAIFENNVVASLEKEGKATGNLHAAPHTESSMVPSWNSAPAAST